MMMMMMMMMMMTMMNRMTYRFVRHCYEVDDRSEVKGSTNMIHLQAEIIHTALLYLNSAPVYRFYLQHLQSMAYSPKASFRPRLRITGHHAPKVNILIFYHREELSILLDTARAAYSRLPLKTYPE